MFISCDSNDDFSKETSKYIINHSFNYNQETDRLYFSIYAEPFMDRGGIQGELDSVDVKFYGFDMGSVIYIGLNDNGVNGDIIKDDKIYGRKINRDTTIMRRNSERIYLEYRAFYYQSNGDIVGTGILLDSVDIGNIIPLIGFINAPDTLIRPSNQSLSLEPISVQVIDPDGAENIRWVGFTSYHLEGDSMMNNGDYIYLHDDGGNIVLYEPNITSGDNLANDGIFSFYIPIYGSESEPPFQTKPGTFRWRFLSQDNSNEYSQAVEHEIVIQ